MRVYLVRHTSVAIPAGICYGQSEVPLSKAYHTELLQVKKKLKGVIFDQYLCSPLERCKKIAEDLASGAKVEADTRLLELNFGDWELKAWDEIDSKEARHWAEHFDTYACPNGESYEDLRKRLAALWNDTIAGNRDGTVLVVTHGGVVRCLLAAILDLPLRNAFKMQVDYGSVSCVEEVNGARSVLFTNH